MKNFKIYLIKHCYITLLFSSILLTLLFNNEVLCYAYWDFPLEVETGTYHWQEYPQIHPSEKTTPLSEKEIETNYHLDKYNADALTLSEKLIQINMEANKDILALAEELNNRILDVIFSSKFLSQKELKYLIHKETYDFMYYRDLFPLTIESFMQTNYYLLKAYTVYADYTYYSSSKDLMRLVGSIVMLHSLYSINSNIKGDYPNCLDSLTFDQVEIAFMQLFAN